MEKECHLWKDMHKLVMHHIQKKRYGENAFETYLNNNNITEKENVKNLINKKQQPPT